MIKLRPNQQKGFDDIRALMRSGKRRIIAVAPPGYGKTTLFSAIVDSAIRHGSKVLISVHKKELVFNIRDRLKSQFGIDCGLIMAGQPVNKNRRVQVGSIQTMIRRDIDWFDPDLYQVDEGHRLLTGSHLKMYDKFVCPDNSKRAVPMIIWTATPVRLSKKLKFEDYCDALIQLSTYRQEMEAKNLVPVRSIYPSGTASLEGVKIRMVFGEKEFDQEETSKRFSEERIVKALYSQWKKHTGGVFQSLCFNIDKAHNKAVVEYFKSKGVNAVYVDEETPAHERDRIVEKFKKGPFVEDPIMFLGNIGLFTEGVDNQWVKCVLLNYATKSFSKYVQSTARGSRPCWNSDYSDWLKVDGKYYKKELLVMDFGGNVVRHGLLPDYDMFGFDLSGQKKKGEAPVKTCPECREVIYASYSECPHCQYKFPVEKKKDTKKYADEVDMVEANSDKHLQKMILSMDAERIWSVHPGYLRVVALVKGYQPQWAYHCLKDRGELPDWHDGTPGAWARFNKYLEQQEKEKGMFTVYQRMKQNQIKK